MVGSTPVFLLGGTNAGSEDAAIIMASNNGADWHEVMHEINVDGMMEVQGIVWDQAEGAFFAAVHNYEPGGGPLEQDRLYRSVDGETWELVGTATAGTDTSWVCWLRTASTEVS